jgi:hypothetical protein
MGGIGGLYAGADHGNGWLTHLSAQKLSETQRDSLLICEILAQKAKTFYREGRKEKQEAFAVESFWFWLRHVRSMWI